MAFSIPNDKKVLMMELPPDDTNGKVMPVKGKIPKFMPIVMNTWMKIWKKMPIEINLPIWSSTVKTMDKILTNRKKYRKISTMPPIKPNDSTRVAKIKSVWNSGRKKSLLWVPRPNPKPHKPPLPTAIIDWMAL